MEMVGWHHQLNGHERGQTLGNSEGQGSLGCCSPCGHKRVRHDLATEQQNACRHRSSSSLFFLFLALVCWSLLPLLIPCSFSMFYPFFHSSTFSSLSSFLPDPHSSLFHRCLLFPFTGPWLPGPSFILVALLFQKQKLCREAHGAVFCPVTPRCLPATPAKAHTWVSTLHNPCGGTLSARIWRHKLCCLPWWPDICYWIFMYNSLWPWTQTSTQPQWAGDASPSSTS